MIEISDSHKMHITDRADSVICYIHLKSDVFCLVSLSELVTRSLVCIKTMQFGN